jgi:hypothetical protein
MLTNAILVAQFAHQCNEGTLRNGGSARRVGEAMPATDATKTEERVSALERRLAVSPSPLQLHCPRARVCDGLLRRMRSDHKVVCGTARASVWGRSSRGRPSARSRLTADPMPATSRNSCLRSGTAESDSAPKSSLLRTAEPAEPAPGCVPLRAPFSGQARAVLHAGPGPPGRGSKRRDPLGTIRS